MNGKLPTGSFDLSACSAAVVGCGGLGTNAGVHLCGMGIGSLLLIDDDTVEPQNLNRQFFYTASDVGKPKCMLLAERLSAYAPACRITPLRRKIRTANDLIEAKDADVLISAVDNAAARRVLNDFCKASAIPLVNGGVHGIFGTAYAYIPGRTPDLEDARLLERENDAPVSVSSTVGVIGALQAQLAAQILSGSGQYGGRLYVFDDNEIQSILIR